ncbi:MAG: MBL fold metallo-hydrolase [Pseudomonadota bacterium]
MPPNTCLSRLRRRAALVLATGIVACLSAAAGAQQADSTPFCGNEGVWIQILGSGGPELDDEAATASYVVFVDNRARVLVDAAAGSSTVFERAGADFADLDAIALTQVQAPHVTELPAYVHGSFYADRDRPLPVLGPDGTEDYPGTEALLERLIGPEGAFPYLADFLTRRSRGGYVLEPQEIAASGRRRWSEFGSANLRLSAVPVSHGDVPALAWRVDVGDESIVFTGDFSNLKNVMPSFAEGADALVIHHSIAEGTRGRLLDLHVTPGQIGRIADQADVRMVILGHRMNRTRGRESATRDAIEEHFSGPLIFANDQECWGL